MKTNLLILAIIFVFCQASEAQWTRLNNFYNVKDVITLHNNVFIIARLTASDSEFLYKSSDNGTTWNKSYPNRVYSGTANGSGVITDGTKLYTHSSGNTEMDTLFISTNEGTNWSKITSFVGIPSNHFLTHLLYGEPGALFATFRNINTGQYYIYKSTDSGISWSLKYNNPNGYVYYMNKIDNISIANTESGTDNPNCLLSQNGGDNWSPISKSFTSLAKIGPTYFAGDYSWGDSRYIHKSTNNGVNWSPILNSQGTGGHNLVYIGNTLITTNRDFLNGSIFSSTNSGISWVEKNSGYNSSSFIDHLVYNSTYFFIVNYSGDLYRRLYSQLVNITSFSSSVPKNFSISQNFPNPFNPTTNIKFSIPKAGFVNIKVFNLVGREVKELVNQNMSVGEYNVDFDGSGLESGIYFYRIKASDFIDTKKMVLLK